jgi:plastocyanin
VTFSGSGSGDRADGTYQRTFPDAGTFSYQCSNHAGMTGSVIVQ